MRVRGGGWQVGGAGMGRWGLDGDGVCIVSPQPPPGGDAAHRIYPTLPLEPLALAHLAGLPLPLPPPQRERVGRLGAKVGAICVPHHLGPHTPLQLQQTRELTLDGDCLQHGGGKVRGRDGQLALPCTHPGQQVCVPCGLLGQQSRTAANWGGGDAADGLVPHGWRRGDAVTQAPIHIHLGTG